MFQNTKPLEKCLNINQESPLRVRRLGHKLHVDTLISLKATFKVAKNRILFNKEGLKGVSNDIVVRVTDEVAKDLLENFDLATPKPVMHKTADGQSILSGFVWKIYDAEDAVAFLNLFEDLKVFFEMVCIRDSGQKGKFVTIVDPRQKAPYIFSKEHSEEFSQLCERKNIKGAVMSHLKVLIGRVPGKKRACPLKLVFTRDLWPALPGGTLKLHFFYQRSKNGIIEEELVEGEEIEEEEEEDAFKAKEITMREEETVTREAKEESFIDRVFKEKFLIK